MRIQQYLAGEAPGARTAADLGPARNALPERRCAVERPQRLLALPFGPARGAPTARCAQALMTCYIHARSNPQCKSVVIFLNGTNGCSPTSVAVLKVGCTLGS